MQPTNSAARCYIKKADAYTGQSIVAYSIVSENWVGEVTWGLNSGCFQTNVSIDQEDVFLFLIRVP
jgi:hypothetical protein